MCATDYPALINQVQRGARHCHHERKPSYHLEIVKELIQEAEVVRYDCNRGFSGLRFGLPTRCD